MILFCFGNISALGAKWLRSILERHAFQVEILPAWNGRPVALGEAVNLRTGIATFARALADYLPCPTYPIRSSISLPTRLRRRAGRSDALLFWTAMRWVMEASYSLIRFITWAMPILGFLGTVLGITKAISGAIRSAGKEPGPGH